MRHKLKGGIPSLTHFDQFLCNSYAMPVITVRGCCSRTGKEKKNKNKKKVDLYTRKRAPSSTMNRIELHLSLPITRVHAHGRRDNPGD